jgi:hypothetical protein
MSDEYDPKDGQIDMLSNLLADVQTERDQLRAALAKAKEALKPFAVRAVFYDLERRKDAWPLDLEAGDHPGNLEVGDLRRAKAALASLALLEAKAGGR